MTRPELALVRGGAAEEGPNASQTGAPDASSPEMEVGRALSTLAAASSQRMEHRELEAVRLALLNNVLITGRDACAALQAWLSQCLSEYRGSRTAWDLQDTTAHLRIALARFHATALDSSQLLRSIMPGLGDDSIGERLQRSVREVNGLGGIRE
jgi:hypothetical protein